MRARQLACWLLWRSGVAALARRLLVANGSFALLFHAVSRQRLPDLSADLQPRFSTIELRQALAWIGGRFTFLSPTEFLESNRNGVLLTFDDGLANAYTNVLPLLEEFRAPAVFFVSTQHVCQPRDWLPAARHIARKGWGQEQNVPPELAADFFDGLSIQQLVACAQSPWVTLGSHTVSHPFLTQCPSSQLKDELEESRRFLEQVSNKAVDLFAYPTGDYDLRVAQAVCRAGYRAAFAVDPLPLGLPAFEIPPLGLYASDPAYLSLKLSGLHRRPLKARPIL